MRFFTVFTLVCWVFLATVYLPIASADDAGDAADDADVLAAVQAVETGASVVDGNMAPVTGALRALKAHAASPGELTIFFYSYPPPSPPIPYLLASIHSFTFLISFPSSLREFIYFLSFFLGVFVQANCLVLAGCCVAALKFLM